MDMDHALRNRMLSNYLKQQANNIDDQTDETDQNNEVLQPQPEELTEFRNYVKAYTETDNTIKQLRNALKERNAIKSKLSEKIIDFMAKYDIDDLNTADGKLSYRVTRVKVPVKVKEAKNKLIEYYDTIKESEVEDLVKKIFESTQIIEKQHLKRVKQPN